MPTPIQELVAGAPKQWPPEFTEQDREFMSAVDILTVDLCQQFAAMALTYRQQLFTALLKQRGGLN